MKEPLKVIYIFLAENIVIRSKKLALFDKYYFTRATDSESRFLENFIGKNAGILTTNTPFVSGFGENKEYNLWVIKHPYNRAHGSLKYIFALSKLNLTFLLEWIELKNENYLIINDIHTKIVYSELCNDKFPQTIINRDSIKEFKMLWELFLKFGEDYNNFVRIDKVLKDFMDLKQIHRESSFKFLGYFSILEYLLTHNKGKNQANSSITFQLQNKLKLLNNRFDIPINHFEYFNIPDSISFEKLVEKLYSFRSDIAHGSIPDFEKELTVLKNQQTNAFNFIHELTRKVIIQYLKEPYLIDDLKQC